MKGWISVKNAAQMMGYSENYFRRVWCDSKSPMLTIREQRGPKGQRRVSVSLADVEAILEHQTKRPELDMAG
jgi:hypothetical protein